MVRRRVSLAAAAPVVAVALLAGCSRSSPPQSSAPPVVSLAPAESAPSPLASSASAAPSATSVASTGPADAALAPAPPPAGYPIGRECSRAGAIAEEHRTLPPRERWVPLLSRAQRLRLRVPPGVFTTTEGRDGLRLVSALSAAGLGPDAKDHRFSIRLLRQRRSADALLADTSKTSPLAGMMPDMAFPGHTTASFVAQPEDPVCSGASARVTLAGRPGYLWVAGVEGYDTDQVLVDLGADDALLAVADWNTAVMAGQPECYQRAVIAGVMDSLEVSAQ